jgi:integrase
MSSGLRMGELLALRSRDVEFVGATIRVRASYAAGHMTTPKSRKVPAVAMAPDRGCRGCPGRVT